MLYEDKMCEYERVNCANAIGVMWHIMTEHLRLGKRLLCDVLKKKN